jgi:hypothetical protein
LRYNPDTNEETEHPVAEYEERTEINPDALRDYFGDSKFYKDEETAHKAAEKLIEHYGYVEYGIVTIYYDKEFPK